MSGIVARFNDVKKKNPGMSDSDAMEQAMKEQGEFIKKVRESDKKKAKKPGWIEKLKMGATKHIKEKYHSPAGREHLRRKKAGAK